jgi:pimeloyl-ACP methyl ester carboxylesterase
MVLQRSLRTLTTAMGSAVDRALLATIARQALRGQGRLPTESHAERLRRLEAVRERYATDENLRDAERFFPVKSGPIEVRETAAGRFDDGAPITDLAWQCDAAAIDPEVGARIDADPYNRDVRVRWIGEPASGRPALALVHGYLGGEPKWEQKFFPVRRLREWGFDVAIVTLPFHGPRKDPARKGAPKFPSVDPAFNIEVWRRAIIELRELTRVAKQRGARSIGVLGMSLGGYTSALLACAEPTLSVCVPMIPLASLADFSLQHNRLPGTPSQQRELHAALERAMAPISPVHRSALIDHERMIVVAARGDRVTPPSHADRLAAKHDARLLSFEGGHLLQVGRARALEAVHERIRALGVLDAR